METGNSSEDVIYVAVYMNRRRGSVRCKHCFVAFKDPVGITWHVEPINERSTKPQDIMKIHSIRDEDVLVGGELSRESLDILFLRVDLDYFYAFLSSAFGIDQPHACELPLFVDAEVRLDSKPLGVGTVRDVIKKSRSGFQSSN